MRLARAEEGGPVFDVAGGFLGISTLGPHGSAIIRDWSSRLAPAEGDE